MEIFANPRFLEVVVHDLRTPLNVINLAFRMLDPSALSQFPALAEDLAMIHSNAQELERMLTYLVDVSRLPRADDQLAPERFDPLKLVEGVVEDHRTHSGAAPVEIQSDGAPPTVQLDLGRARMAIHKSLANASAASAGKPVRILLQGGPDRCIIRFETSDPPRSSVRTHHVEPEQFQRILGTVGERRGLDLAIAGQISTLFGGEARLEATPGQGSAVVLDWPVSLPTAG